MITVSLGDSLQTDQFFHVPNTTFQGSTEAVTPQLLYARNQATIKRKRRTFRFHGGAFFIYLVEKTKFSMTPRFSLREDKNCTNTNGQRFLLFVLYYTWKNIKTECLLPLFL